MTIWKFSLGIEPRQAIILPGRYVILSVQMQHDNLCLWAMVDPDEAFHEQGISIYGTGHPLPERPGVYIGTVQRLSFVWHVFADEV